MPEFQQHGCKVVLLANGTWRNGVIWRKENPIQFPAYCDPEWTVYRQLGLRRIIGIGATMSNFGMHYAERKMKGLPFPKLYEGDDLLIMGGDFIVKKDGKIVYAFHQTTPQCPDVQDILSCLKAQ